MLRINYCLTHTVLGFKTNSTGMFPNWLAARSSSWFWVFSDTSTPERWPTHHQDQRHKLQVQLYMFTVLATRLCERRGIRKFYHSSFCSIDVFGAHACSHNGGTYSWMVKDKYASLAPQQHKKEGSKLFFKIWWIMKIQLNFHENNNYSKRCLMMTLYPNCITTR